MMTPAQFMAQTGTEEIDADETPTTLDPLASIAGSLQTIAEVLQARGAAEERAQVAREHYDDLDAQYAALEGLLDAKRMQIEAALVVCKPSVSKLANQIRSVLQPVEPTANVEPTPEPPAEGTPPGRDADVEEWRSYARSRGYAGPDVDQMNRSQVRTMLGIPHAD